MAFHSPRRKAWLATFTTAGINSWAIIKETSKRQLLPDRLPLIFLSLKKNKKKKKTIIMSSLPINYIPDQNIKDEQTHSEDPYDIMR